MSWKLEGTYFETCNCEAACPCVFLSKPTEGECGVLVAWHIDKGNFEGVPLEGLNVALAVRSPGHMAQVKWDAALYLDERANAKQKDALAKIFGGQAGGHPARLASHVGKILGLASVPMKFSASGKQRSLTIPNIADATIEALEGQGGAEITVTNHPLCIAPGNPAVTARSKKFTYKDHGMSWNLSGKNGFFSPFQYAA
ncbi:MAG TPA: DUF1326 domain-containing protein [Burkholderiales bacterium]|nr:DUF1326 domain-containing protein [Burkholderiales bacterium]